VVTWAVVVVRLLSADVVAVETWHAGDVLAAGAVLDMDAEGVVVGVAQIACHWHRTIRHRLGVRNVTACRRMHLVIVVART